MVEIVPTEDANQQSMSSIPSTNITVGSGGWGYEGVSDRRILDVVQVSDFINAPPAPRHDNWRAVGLCLKYTAFGLVYGLLFGAIGGFYIGVVASVVPLNLGSGLTVLLVGGAAALPLLGKVVNMMMREIAAPRRRHEISYGRSVGQRGEYRRDEHYEDQYVWLLRPIDLYQLGLFAVMLVAGVLLGLALAAGKPAGDSPLTMLSVMLYASLLCGLLGIAYAMTHSRGLLQKHLLWGGGISLGLLLLFLMLGSSVVTPLALAIDQHSTSVALGTPQPTALPINTPVGGASSSTNKSLSPTPVGATSGGVTGTQYAVIHNPKATITNLRSKPSNGGSVVRQLSEGERVELINVAQVAADGYKWQKVRTIKGEEGWVVADKLQPAKLVCSQFG